MTDQVTNEARFFDAALLRLLEASSYMTLLEERASERRAKEYRRQWEEHKQDQLQKYGLDGGPSPCVIMKDPFIPREAK